jgi:flagellar motor switch protein FliN/FliY
MKTATSSPRQTAPASGNGNGNGNGGAPANVRAAQFAELTPAPSGQPGYNIDLLLGVNLQVAVEIGRTTLPIRDVLALTPGSIVELDKLAGEKVDVLINGRPIAQGEVVVVDENFGVRITDVVSRQARLSPQGR